MKYVAYLFLVTLFPFGYVFPQTVVDGPTIRSFSPRSDEFSVEAPCDFRKLDHEQEWRVYKCLLGNRYFLITSVSNKVSSQIYAINEQAKGEIKRSETRIGNRFTGPLLARSSFEDIEGFFQTVIEVQTNRRFYLFHTLSDTPTDRFVEEFIRSIKFLAAPAESDAAKTIANPRSIGTLMAGPSRATGAISRQNAALTKNPNSGREFTFSADQTSPFKVLNVARAGYSGLAVLYQIQGVVIVRVQFLHTGQIGIVTPVEKLPFGLTANALAAAQFLLFEPEVSSGSPRTTVRPVHYDFKIY